MSRFRPYDRFSDDDRGYPPEASLTEEIPLSVYSHEFPDGAYTGEFGHIADPDGPSGAARETGLEVGRHRARARAQALALEQERRRSEGSAPVKKQTLGRASALMASGTLVSRMLGLIRQSLLTYCIGSLTISSGAFQVANTLPNLIYILISGGLLNAVLIPQITKALKQPDGDHLVDRLLTACFALVLGATIVATVAAAPLVNLYGLRGHGPEVRLAVDFAYLCIPQLFFYGTYAILGQVLNARGSYGAFMWTPVLANVVQIAGLLAFQMLYPGSDHLRPEQWTRDMVLLLGVSTTLGIVLQAVALVPALRASGYRWRPRWGLRGHGFGSATRTAGWAFAALLVSQVGGWATMKVMLTVQARASHDHLLVAGVMVYNVAFLFFMLPHSIITTSIITALYPPMSVAANEGNRSELRVLLTRGLTLPSVALVPITVAGLVLAVPGLGVAMPSLLRQGSLRETAIVFGVMIFGLIPFGWTTLQARFLFATDDGRTNLWLQVLLTGVQVVFAVGALWGPPGHSVAMIAIGQTLGNLVAGVTFVLIAQRRVGGLPLNRIVRLHVRLAIISTVAGLLTWGLIEGIQVVVGIGFLSFLTQLLVGGLIFLAVFLVLSHTFHVKEVADLLSPVTRRLRSRLPVPART
ncbi:murein biosynthesis integral membrane protein MurJ [Arsenicicoccus dermatophilus]|uniref:murein biosynthesis integral membrane protein MurJ n=1 Tax=Arsenicicoccus dermatophilus TaxID=1076331 RepID=UPI001F4CD3F4|nr:lipid II flippase MurJ [Arsenicicoccus dermatophilus]MCH8614097.1 murein biosynthesis integral membrane protein MurJ [Arsenicicoccus dermatophilus]